MEELKKKFMEETENSESIEMIVFAVELPTGATEIIINSQMIGSKIDYYRNAYDDDFRLKANPDVRIRGYMLL